MLLDGLGYSMFQLTQESKILGRKCLGLVDSSLSCVKTVGSHQQHRCYLHFVIVSKALHCKYVLVFFINLHKSLMKIYVWYFCVLREITVKNEVHLNVTCRELTKLA